jgi:hypothetical protein
MDAGIIESFKAHYRRAFLEWIITQIEAESGVKHIDLLTCISYVMNAWNHVSEETVRNCWVHTGIISAPLAATLHQENVPKRQNLESELDSLIEKLDLEDRMAASSYLTFENDIQIDAGVDDADSNTDLECEDNEESDDEGEESVFTHQEALKVVTQLMTYASIHAIDDLKLENIKTFSRTNVLKGLKQSSILTYFHKVD